MRETISWRPPSKGQFVEERTCLLSKGQAVVVHLPVRNPKVEKNSFFLISFRAHMFRVCGL